MAESALLRNFDKLQDDCGGMSRHRFVHAETKELRKDGFKFGTQTLQLMPCLSMVVRAGKRHLLATFLILDCPLVWDDDGGCVGALCLICR
jgi:hypothetical protein